MCVCVCVLQGVESGEAYTNRLRTVCDLGLAVARTLVERQCASAGLPAPDYPPEHHPASIVLPKQLFDCTKRYSGGVGKRELLSLHACACSCSAR